MGNLTTHILDTAAGRPAAGVRITAYADRNGWIELAESVTNADGRCDAPLLHGNKLAFGRYRLVFHIGPYFRSQGHDTGSLMFLDDVPVEFGVADPSLHYHVPLLITPWSYATYRGS